MSNTAIWGSENDKAQVKRSRGSGIRRGVKVNPITVVVGRLLENQLKDWPLVLELRNRCRMKQEATTCASTLCAKIVDQVDPRSTYRKSYPLDSLFVHGAVKLWAILLFRAGHEFVDQCRSKDCTAAMLVVLRSSEVDWPVKVNMARLVQTAVSRFRLREFGKVRAAIDDENLIDERQITPFEDTHHIFNPDLPPPRRPSRSEGSQSGQSTASHNRSTDVASASESQPRPPTLMVPGSPPPGDASSVFTSSTASSGGTDSSHGRFRLIHRDTGGRPRRPVEGEHLQPSPFQRPSPSGSPVNDTQSPMDVEWLLSECQFARAVCEGLKARMENLELPSSELATYGFLGNMVQLSGRWSDLMSHEVEMLTGDSNNADFTRRYRAFCETQRKPFPSEGQMMSAKEELLDQLLEAQGVIADVTSKYERLERRSTGDQTSMGHPDYAARSPLVPDPIYFPLGEDDGQDTTVADATAWLESRNRPGPSYPADSRRNPTPSAQHLSISEGDRRAVFTSSPLPMPTASAPVSFTLNPNIGRAGARSLPPIPGVHRQ